MPPHARTLYLQGVQAFSTERWADARTAFADALALYYHDTAVGDLGSAELRLGEHRSAAQHLATYVRLLEQDAAASPEQRAQGRAELDQAKARVGTVVVRVDIDGARITGDHELLGVTPLLDPLFVEPGHRVFIVARRGCSPRVFKVHIAAGEQTSLDVSFCKLDAKRSLSSAQAPGANKPSPATVTPSRRDGDGRLEPHARRSWVPVIVLGAASAVGLGVGVGLTVAAKDGLEEVRTRNAAILAARGDCAAPAAAVATSCEDLRSSGERADLLGGIAGGAFVASGVLAAAAITYALWPRFFPATSNRVQAMPAVHARGAGIIAVGSW
jgi:hypothetical protein